MHSTRLGSGDSLECGRPGAALVCEATEPRCLHYPIGRLYSHGVRPKRCQAVRPAHSKKVPLIHVESFNSGPESGRQTSKTPRLLDFLAEPLEIGFRKKSDAGLEPR